MYQSEHKHLALSNLATGHAKTWVQSDWWITDNRNLKSERRSASGLGLLFLIRILCRFFNPPRSQSNSVQFRSNCLPISFWFEALIARNSCVFKSLDYPIARLPDCYPYPPGFTPFHATSPQVTPHNPRHPMVDLFGMPFFRATGSSYLLPFPDPQAGYRALQPADTAACCLAVTGIIRYRYRNVKRWNVVRPENNLARGRGPQRTRFSGDGVVGARAPAEKVKTVNRAPVSPRFAALQPCEAYLARSGRCLNLYSPGGKLLR